MYGQNPSRLTWMSMARARSPSRRLRSGLRSSDSYVFITSCIPETVLAEALPPPAADAATTAAMPSLSCCRSGPDRGAPVLRVAWPGLSLSKSSSMRTSDLRSASYSWEIESEGLSPRSASSWYVKP